MAAVVCVVLIILLILLLVWCIRRKSHSKYELSKASQLEMGVRKPSKPILGGTWGSRTRSMGVGYSWEVRVRTRTSRGL